jgi:hypothetical protein
LVLVHVAVVLVVQVSIVKIVLMAVMLYGSVSAVWTMDVRMRVVSAMFGAHLNSPYDAR